MMKLVFQNSCLLLFFQLSTTLSTSFLPSQVCGVFERLGRKTLLVVGALMMMVFHISTWACSTQTKNGKIWQYLVVASVFLFVFSFAWTWGPVPWIYQAEVFPLHVSVKGSAVGAVSNFLNNWIIAFVGPALMKAWSTRTFLLFAAACLLAWIYSQFYVIECKGLSIDEMDVKMAGKTQMDF